MFLGALLETLREKLSPDTVWRHNEVGDLPKQKGTEKIARRKALKILGIAIPFTFSHHEMLKGSIAKWNRETIKMIHEKTRATVNLSANNPDHADQLADLGIAPVACLGPSDFSGRSKTPKGRSMIACPSTYFELGEYSCADCGGNGLPLCARQDRKEIIVFPAHGQGKKHINEMLSDV